MTHNDLLNLYSRKESGFSASLQDINKKINIVSNTRLAVALVFLLLLYLGLSHHALMYALPLLLVVFIILVRKHARLYGKKVHLENLKRIQHEELHSLQGDFSHNSSGSEFINVHHPYTHDLDIFGEGSLFQYINRSSTRGGKNLMAERLSSTPEDLAEVNLRQEAIGELAAKTDFRQEIQALGMQIDEHSDDRRQLESWLAQPAFVFGRKSYNLILRIFPLITVSLVIAAFFVGGLGAYAVLAAGLQWVFLGFHLKRINAFHQYISHKKNTLEKYAQLLFYFRKEKFNAPLMQSLSRRATEGGEKIRQLSALVRAFDARLNSLTNLFVNSLLLYDLQCVYRLEKWKQENAAHLPGWLDVIRQVEFLCSLGTFSFNHPQFAVPEINNDLELSAKGLGHPLLDENERVVNDMHLDGVKSVMIITGANMAGKSTFLRSLGVNVVLALTGAPVCASEFRCPRIELRSGMRTADSLKEHQSYFYAELNRLKSIMDDLREGKQILILLDEILKGTNSTDKQAGSVALVRQLIGQSCLAIIATHDLALGDLEDVYPGRIFNYSFEANIENEHLSFDYKLKRGLAQKMNATFLMRKMGIIGPDS
jgi:DNA mismatch repair ATPase MutS